MAYPDVRTDEPLASLRAHLPDAVVYTLFIIALIMAFCSGSVSANRPRLWLTVITFHPMVTLVIFITLDLDRPRRKAGLCSTVRRK